MHFHFVQLTFTGWIHHLFQVFQRQSSLVEASLLEEEYHPTLPDIHMHCSTENWTKWQSGYGGIKPSLGQTESIFHKQNNITQSISKAELPHKQGDLCSREGCSCYWLVMLIKIHHFSFPALCFIYSCSNFTINLSHSKLVLLDRKQRHAVFSMLRGISLMEQLIMWVQEPQH